jgi:hypothetical protein
VSAGGLSVVIAVQRAAENVPEILERLACEGHPDVEFFLCHAGDDAGSLRMPAAPGNVRVLTGAPGSLIPHLWRDGIRAARHATVAVTTAHCIPDEDWLPCLLRLDLGGEIAGVGGVIESHPASDAVGWAIYLMRYLPYAPPQSARRVSEIAADNAAYRRAEILRHEDLLRDGFWEPSFHARLRADGLALALEPRLRVFHRNCYGAGEFFGQRLAHGRDFGRARAARLPVAKRWLLLAASPILPLVFLHKIVAAALRRPHCRRQLPRALPWLLYFLAGWGLGEARGYLDSVARG